MSKNFVLVNVGSSRDRRWKETWRDHPRLDWLCEMDTCEDAIESLQIHISNCDSRYEGGSIKDAEETILDILSEIERREYAPEWPTLDQMAKYCGKYPVIGLKSDDVLERTWNLTPDLLRTRWVSEDDFYQWRLNQYGVRPPRIEPMPEQLIGKQVSQERKTS